MEQSEKEEFKTALRQIVGVAMEYFKGQVSLIAEQYGGLLSRMDGMDAKIDSYGAKVDILSLEVGLLRRDMKIVKADIAVIKSDIVAMKGDISSIKIDFKVKADTKDVAMLDRRVRVLEAKS